MDGIQEGGVLTQKVRVTMGIIALLMMGALICCVSVSDVSDADAVVSIEASSDFAGVNASYSESTLNKVTYTLYGDASYYYEATLLDSAGVSSGKISPQTGTLSSGSAPSKAVTVTAPLVTGDYTFNVKFYTNSETKDIILAEKDVPLKVVDPIVLKFTLKNDGESSVTFTAYFKINGEKVEDSSQSVTVGAGSTQDVSYKYYTRDVSDTKYSLETDDQIIKNSISGLSEEKTFYAHDTDYTVITALVVVTLLILFVLMVFIYRKPVINKGKPKGRR